MAKYTYECECKEAKTIELGYKSDVPKILVCVCGDEMLRRYEPVPFHLKGVGWGSDKTGER